MILGLVTMIVLFVIRLGPQPAAKVPLPGEIALPEGVQALSVAWGANHYVVVTADQQVLIFDLEGKLLQSIGIE